MAEFIGPGIVAKLKYTQAGSFFKGQITSIGNPQGPQCMAGAKRGGFSRWMLPMVDLPEEDKFPRQFARHGPEDGFWIRSDGHIPE